jgi:hypothetical protein
MLRKILILLVLFCSQVSNAGIIQNNKEKFNGDDTWLKLSLYEMMTLNLCVQSRLTCSKLNLNYHEAKKSILNLCGCTSTDNSNSQDCSDIELVEIYGEEGKIIDYKCISLN